MKEEQLKFGALFVQTMKTLYTQQYNKIHLVLFVMCERLVCFYACFILKHKQNNKLKPSSDNSVLSVTLRINVRR